MEKQEEVNIEKKTEIVIKSEENKEQIKPEENKEQIQTEENKEKIQTEEPEQQKILIKNKKLRSLLQLDSAKKNTSIFSKYTYENIKSINPHLKIHLQKLNFTKLTKIQLKCYVPIYKSKNTLIKAQTGSGKTLAYLVPILNRLIQKPIKITRKQGCKILIICPTRELCLQIEKVLQLLTKACIWIVPGALIGGVDVKKEKSRIRKGLNIVVGTPGKLDYHLKNTHNFYMEGVETVVFEEADQILDMGFAKEVRSILETLREQRVRGYQNVLVAASISGKLEAFLEDILHNSFLEKIDGESEQKKRMDEILGNFRLVGFNKNIKQYIVPDTLNHFYSIMEERKKVSYFLTLAKLLENEKVIIFVSTADQANYLKELCLNFQTPAFSFDKKSDKKKFFSQSVLKIHGFMNQKERAEVFYKFNNLENGLLFCTNVASRGLDFGSISVIILFDVSPSYKDYINRVGRTARIEKVGTAISLLYEKEEKYAKKLEENCKAKELNIRDIENQFRNFYFKDKKVKNFSQFFDIELKHFCTVDTDMKYLARRAFNSFCRAYSMLKDSECFNLKNLNIHQISKSYGLSSSRSGEAVDKKYKTIKDTKKISYSEQAHLNLKKKKTEMGYKIVARKGFGNDEFF